MRPWNPTALHIGRRRHGVQHPAGEFQPARRAHRIHLRLDMDRRVAADGGDMDIAEMRQVHQVVHHQHGGGLDGIGRVLVRPVRGVVVPGIATRSSPGRPLPDRPSRSTAMHPARPGGRRATRARSGMRSWPGMRTQCAGAVEGQAVVAAGEAVLGRPCRWCSGAPRWQHMSSKRGGSSAGVAEQHNGFIADAASKRASVISSAQAATYQALRMNISALPAAVRRLEAGYTHDQGRVGVAVKLFRSHRGRSGRCSNHPK